LSGRGKEILLKKGRRTRRIHIKAFKRGRKTFVMGKSYASLQTKEKGVVKKKRKKKKKR